MAGSAICRALERAGYNQLLTASRSELDLIDGPTVEAWFAKHQPTVVVLAAAGGDPANSVFHRLSFGEPPDPKQCDQGLALWDSRLLFLKQLHLPKFAEQPIEEEALLTVRLSQRMSGTRLPKLPALSCASTAYRASF